jgi:hypothetical protein
MTSLVAALLLCLQEFPPKLPDGQAVLTVRSEEFLKSGSTLRDGVAVAKAAPTIDFLYFPGQDYPGKPWSVWGDSLAINGKYYASIGDHLAPGGNAFVYEYDPAAKTLRRLLDVRKLLQIPEGDYSPGKIHGRLDRAEDGWLYCSTHRGSTKVTTDAYRYKGDWILRLRPESGESEIVASGPVAKHCIPCSVVDPKRMIFYGGTAPGSGGDGEGVRFFAYDLKDRKVLYSCADGPARYMMLAGSTGRVYWVPGKEDGVGALVRWDPAVGGAPVKLDVELGVRSATQETPQGLIYTVSKGGKSGTSTIFSFDTKTEKAEDLGEAAVGMQTYVTSIDADPSGRFLYYIPGAHGGAERDGTPVVQFDVRNRRRKVIAFLDPYFRKNAGGAPVGTFSSAIDEKGETLYVTWNVNRSGRAWDCTALTAIHIPASERE